MPSVLMRPPAEEDDFAASSFLASQPRPRPSRSPHQAARIRVQNRRLEFLRRNPSYVESSDREFADVQLYHELVRAFQTPEERSAEARDKGFGQVLEASILRNPERLQRVGEEEEEEEEEGEEGQEGEEGEEGEEEEEEEEEAEKDRDTDMTGDRLGSNGHGAVPSNANGYRNSHNDTAAAKEDLGDLYLDFEPDSDLTCLSDPSGPSSTSLPPRDIAGRRWHAFVRDWFVRGGALADGFDYVAVDDDSDYDVLARADAEDAWFDDESPGWVDDDGDDTRMRTGETGVQDY